MSSCPCRSPGYESLFASTFGLLAVLTRCGVCNSVQSLIDVCRANRQCRAGGTPTGQDLPRKFSESMTFFWIVAGIAVVAIALALSFSQLRSQPPPNLSDEHIRRAFRRGDHLDAIRWYRILHGGSLKRAKSEVASLAADQTDTDQKRAQS